jgi:hypothetical protein
VLSLMIRYYPVRGSGVLHPPPQYGCSLGPNPSPESERSVLRLEACWKSDNTFKLVGSGEEVIVFGPRPHCGPLYIPVHGCCLQVVDRCIDSVRTSAHAWKVFPEDRIHSIKQLWEVLYQRVHGSLNHRGSWVLPEPHDYFGGIYCRGVDWESGNDPKHGEVCLPL